MNKTTFPKLEPVFYCSQWWKGNNLLFAASLLNYSFLSQSGLGPSEPAGQCDWLVFSMQKFFPVDDDHRKDTCKIFKCLPVCSEKRRKGAHSWNNSDHSFTDGWQWLLLRRSLWPAKLMDFPYLRPTQFKWFKIYF